MMMPRFWADAREHRERPVITVMPYALLALLVAVTVINKRSAGGSLLFDLVLCALAAVWMLCVFTLRPAWRDRPAVMTVFVAVLVVIMMVLVVRDPWFGFFTPAGYVYAFRLLPWPWRLPGVAGVAVVASIAQAYDVDKTTLGGLMTCLAVVAANVLPMCGFAWFAERAAQRNEQRLRALEELGEANRRLEATLAENAGLHERLLAQAREAGVLDERQRMAREIHDTLAQGLTGIITQLQAAEQAGQDPAEWHRHVTAATTLARESLTEARRSVHALRPEPLRTARLSEALADVADRWSALHGVAVQVATTGTARPLPPEAEVALLRTAQEALANVAKHARAGRVGVTLSYMEREVAVDVWDDGRGFDPARLGSGGPHASAGGGESGGFGGFGLVAMRQRIEALSGTLQVESEPGAGTGISACIPTATPAATPVATPVAIPAAQTGVGR
ncbi:sensor histidine kinase [Nonomuraea guangzhouensis]|uniref:Oxygen sensor histidine kinase NreB n=1 Tax=Nonomuraea guangzhouensis TaxID=1291555 RepID=A0ABW4GL11_9ACTN|nr:sensor histidine kinase [Nonomuraea guangzhouensis]